MPQNAAGPADPMAAAKAAAATLAGARQKFPQSMAKAAGVVTPTPKKNMTASPVTVGKESAPAGVVKGAGGDVPAGIQWNRDQGGAGKDVMPKAPKPASFHKGGKIKKDGVQVIDAKKGETVLPTHDKKKALKLAKEHVMAMAHKEGKDDMAGLGQAASDMKKKITKRASDMKKKVEPMMKKKAHAWKRTIVDHHADGSHTKTMEHDTDSAMNMTTAHPDTDSMMDHMQSAMGPSSLAEAAGGGDQGAAAPAPEPAQA